MSVSIPLIRVDRTVNAAVELAHSDICRVIPDFLYTYHAADGMVTK
jgi:hypothetical protein